MKLGALKTAALLLAAGTLAAPRPARAMSRDVRSVLTISAYGMAGGTVLGLAALPFTQDVRTLFIGTSLGLYLGIAVGLYYVYDRGEQEQQQRARMHAAADPEAGLRRLAAARELSGWEAAAPEPLRLTVPVLSW